MVGILTFLNYHYKIADTAYWFSTHILMSVENNVKFI